MCNTDECVEMVKGLAAELLREQQELVERLNAMQGAIEADTNLTSKALHKIAWMEKKKRSVQLLKTVQPSPHSVFSFSPVPNGLPPDAADVRT